MLTSQPVDLWAQLVMPVEAIAAIIAILAALITLTAYLYRKAFTPWRRSTARWERCMLEAVANARTIKDVELLVGRPADTHRDLYVKGRSAFPERPQEDRLASHFWSLPHTYLEVFSDQTGRFYGYTVIGIAHGLGPINVAGLTVELGRTRWTEAWADSGGLRPELIVDPGNRSWCGAEASRAYGWTTYRTWAIGNLNVGIDGSAADASHGGAQPAGLAMFNSMQGGSDFHDAPQGWETDPNTLAWRSTVVVNTVAYARGGAVRLEMVNLHDQELVEVDPGRSPGRARVRGRRAEG